MTIEWTIVLIVIAVVVTAIVTAIIVHEKDLKKLEYMLDAFEDEEYNFAFLEKSRYNKALNRIKWIAERRRQQHEEESWTKLIRVLTHEIMNTVSPIVSLSAALTRQLCKPKINSKDIVEGLKAISSASTDLLHFVESYRELTGVAKPIMKALMLDELIDKAIGLTREQCAERGVECTYQPKSDDMLIYADESQIERILINLIKNAIQAGARHICITAETDSCEHTNINIANDGEPITPESQEQIFIPFYTTKQEGSGIGLSLSRQIMRAHNGTLDLVRSDDQWTEFRMKFD